MRQFDAKRSAVWQPSDTKCEVVLHQKAESIEPERLAILLHLLERAFSLGETIPGVTFPIHVTVQYGGQQICGTVAPAGMDQSPDVSH